MMFKLMLSVAFYFSIALFTSNIATGLILGTIKSTCIFKGAYSLSFTGDDSSAFHGVINKCNFASSNCTAISTHFQIGDSPTICAIPGPLKKIEYICRIERYFPVMCTERILNETLTYILSPVEKPCIHVTVECNRIVSRG